MEAYQLQEQILTHGLGQVWKIFWSSAHADGVLFPIEGALSGIILGGTRLPQLCVLFVAFCTLQVAAFTAARIVPFSAFAATFYVRPTATISDLSGGWIPSHGFSIEFSRDVLERFRLIQLAGSADYSRLQKIPTVEATIETGESSQTAPASFQRLDNGYEIRVDTSSIRLPPGDQVHIRLDFNSFFVPKATGAGKDTRELVVKAPALVKLVRGGS
jgi:hypothetical protein